MKYVLMFIGYEVIRPKAIWLWNYLIRKGGEL